MAVQINTYGGLKAGVLAWLARSGDSLLDSSAAAAQLIEPQLRTARDQIDLDQGVIGEAGDADAGAGRAGDLPRNSCDRFRSSQHSLA